MPGRSRTFEDTLVDARSRMRHCSWSWHYFHRTGVVSRVEQVLEEEENFCCLCLSVVDRST